MKKWQNTYSITAASAVKYGGVLESIALMTFGNQIGATIELETVELCLTGQLGGFVFTSTEEISDAVKIGQTDRRVCTCYQWCQVVWTRVQAAFEGKLEEGLSYRI